MPYIYLWGSSSERMINLPVPGRDELWKLLIDTAHSLPMYKSHRRYVEEVMIKETPQILSQELAVQLNITQGEAIVILDEIRQRQLIPNPASADSEKVTRSATDRNLLDFSK
jgi:hypothetical protein